MALTKSWVWTRSGRSKLITTRIFWVSEGNPDNVQLSPTISGERETQSGFHSDLWHIQTRPGVQECLRPFSWVCRGAPCPPPLHKMPSRSEEHTSELQSRLPLV